MDNAAIGKLTPLLLLLKPPSPVLPLLGCNDTPVWVDSCGDGCEWYEVIKCDTPIFIALHPRHRLSPTTLLRLFYLGMGKASR